MKYIITESRFENLIFKYLDNKLDGIELKKGDYSAIVFVFPGEESGLMRWVPSPGQKYNQLWTYYEMVDDVKTMFSMSKFDALDVIGRYVESRYNLKVHSKDDSEWKTIFTV
jgi:hypothetical protein